MNVGTMHVVVYFKCLPQICTKMNGFKFDFSKNFWGGAHQTPSPDPLPSIFLGLCPRFGLRPQFSGALRLQLGLRSRFSGGSRPRFGLRPQLSIGKLGLPPSKINSWIRHCLPKYATGQNDPFFFYMNVITS